jgi:uncharacterized protein YcgL (UPF0745 family)
MGGNAVAAVRGWVYKSRRKEGMYLYLAEEDGLAGLPEGLLRAVGDVAFVMSLELTPDTRLAREDPRQVIANLAQKGYHLQMPPVRQPGPH